MQFENNLLIFFKNEKVLLLLFFLVFINPFFYGDRFLLLFFFLLVAKSFKFKIGIDENVLFLLLFSIFYELIAALRIEAIYISELGIISNIIGPTLLYLVGKYIGVKYSTSQVLTFMLFFIAITYSIVPLISIIKQIIDAGFLEGTRSMYLLWDKSYEISATGLGSYFAMNMITIGLVIVKKKSIFENKIYYALIIIFLLSLVCVLRLGTRTQLAISLIAILFSYLVNFSKQGFSKNLFIIIIFTLIGFYFLYNINSSSDVMYFFADRIDNEEFGIATAGGRTERWIGSLNSVLTDPFGWEYERFGYAHNLWLDVARVSGIIPLFFLLLFTFSSFKILFKALKKLKKNTFVKTYVLLFFLSFFLVFNVEPIMEGMYLFFLLFCMFIGILFGFSNEKSYD